MTLRKTRPPLFFVIARRPKGAEAIAIRKLMHLRIGIASSATQVGLALLAQNLIADLG